MKGYVIKALDIEIKSAYPMGLPENHLVRVRTATLDRISHLKDNSLMAAFRMACEDLDEAEQKGQ